MLKDQPRVIFAEPMDEDDLAVDNEEAVDDEDIADDIPVMKKRKLDSDLQAIADAESQVMLTKHFKLHTEIVPAFTGGKFIMLKGSKFAFAHNNSQVSLIDVASGKVVGKIEQENEDLINFEVSPNQKLLATTNKGYLVRVYSIGEMPTNFDQEWKHESQVVSFKTGSMLGLELCFDPSSRYVAIATSDSQIKIYDVMKGFQTHNFIGHRNIVVNL